MPDSKEIHTTLCYMEYAGHYLMMNRTKKKNDINGGKWIGVGGHLEEGETIEECLVREIREETGFDVLHFQKRGIVHFCYGENISEYMHLFTADEFTGSGITYRNSSTSSADSRNSVNPEAEIVSDTPTVSNPSEFPENFSLPPLPECDEGELQWILKAEIFQLNLWEGDRYFLEKLLKDESNFTLKLVYNAEDKLIEVAFDSE